VLVELAIGARAESVAVALREIGVEASNARGGGGRPPERVDSYLRWADAAARRLRNQVTQESINRLVLTPVYFALVPLGREPSPHAGDLVDRELETRGADLEAAAGELRQLSARWPAAAFLVADTSVFMQHPEKVEDLDFRPLVSVREEPVHLLVPILIIDELDGLKRSRDMRWRASYTLAVFERCVSAPGRVGRLREADFSALDSGGIPRGEVTVEIVLDPPGHVRLPVNDDEIIDRAVALHILAGRPLTIATYDTGQAMRARATPLTVCKLQMPTEEADKSVR
jgi:hypothetical protein